ncbi:carbohydrate kinase family protein [Desulfonatronovibrio magnus]|uniref:carbohydrate kinase family protein n=1 Tax=Desulfonatronovibrio magnus TaxID=698827 RepID=UPI0005EBBB12|nr:carbohydrate kinase [Desulfonatronovibrio magnus]RQD67664.1 MAG: carbohydrate kinase [Desulfonatronovibrio sp. MSAO_Bac4]
MSIKKFDSAIVFGEVLFDVFPGNKRVIGGAPFNVACHLSEFGQNPLFVSKIGNDDPGREVVRMMDNRSVSISGLQRDEQRMTGVVKVSIENHEPSYEIKNNVAYDFIEPLGDGLISSSNRKILYHGTLAVRNSVSRSTLYDLARMENTAVFCDVNLRDPWWNNDLLRDILDWCSYLKVNEDELKKVCDIEGFDEGLPLEDLALKLSRKRGFKCLIVTLGSRGAMLLPHNSEQMFAPSPEVSDFKDSVGAGDAFSSVALLGIIKGWEWSDILHRAVYFAARMCANAGAVPNDRELYEEVREIWRL